MESIGKKRKKKIKTVKIQQQTPYKYYESIRNAYKVIIQHMEDNAFCI